MRYRYTQILVLVLALVIVHSSAAAQSPDCIDPNDQMRVAGTLSLDAGSIDGLDIEGNLVFAGATMSDNDFQVIDISDPASPVIIGTTSIEYSYDMKYSGGFVYSVGWGLRVIDVSTPSNPVQRGIVFPPDEGGSWIDVVGDRAYMIDDSNGLHVVDISDPDAPVILGSIAFTGGWIDDVLVVGDRAYIAQTDADISIVDISDPRTMSVIWTVPNSAMAHSLAGDQGTVCAITDRFDDKTWWLWVLDPSNHDSPAIVSAARRPGHAHDLDFRDGFALVAGSDGLETWDLTDPYAPKQLGSIAGGLWRVAESGPLAVTAGDYSSEVEIRVVDLQSRKAPYVVGHLDNVGFGSGNLAAYGDFVLLSSYTYGVRVHDVSDPQHPVLHGNYKSSNDPNGVALMGDVAFVAEGASLTSIAYRTPGVPTVLDAVATPGWACGVAVIGSYVYVADGDVTLSVYEADPSGTMSFVNSLDLATFGKEITVAETRVYVRDISTIEIIDVSTPATPVHLGSIPAGPYASPMDAVGGRLYTPMGADVAILDVTDPSNVTELGRMSPGFQYEPWSVTVHDNIAYVCDDVAEMVIYDIADPTTPILLTRIAEPLRNFDYPREVLAHGGLMYVAYEVGLVGMETYCPPVRATINVPDDHPTIQAAVNAANPGDEIVIACGTYNEHDILVTKSVTIRGETGDPSCVVVDAQGLGRGISVDNAPPVWIEGVTIRNGAWGSYPGGGGILVMDSEAHLTRVSITNCSNGGLHYRRSRGTLSLCDISGNTGSGGAGATFAEDSVVAVEDCSFVGNIGTFQGNGGAIRIVEGGDVSIVRSRFESNESSVGPAVHYLQAPGSLRIDRCVFVGNRGEVSSALSVSALTRFEVTRSVFSGNSLLDPERVGVPVVQLYSWHAGEGYSTEATILNNTIDQNECGTAGVALDIRTYFDGGSVTADISGNLITHNVATAAMIGTGHSITMSCNNFFGNTGGDWTGDLAVYLNVDGNISADPLFCDAASGDYHVDFSSPCLPINNSPDGCKIGALDAGCGSILPPQDVAVTYGESGNTISWGLPTAARIGPIEGYRIYRSTDPQFTPGPANLVRETSDTTWFDGGGGADARYKVSAVDGQGVESAAVGPTSSTGAETPVVFVGTLHQNTPNPFNPSTRISWVLPNTGRARMQVFDLKGRLVATILDGPMEAGPGQIDWDGRDSAGRRLGSGVYLLRLTSSGFESSRKMMLLK